MGGNDVTAQLAKLLERRDAAERRIREVEAEQRTAVQEREAARARLIEHERRGGAGRRAERAKLETALTQAEAHAAERWPERIEGARAALRDMHAQVHAYTYEHLDELIENVQRDGEVAAERVNVAAQNLVDAYQEREQVAAQIARHLATADIRIRPGDITFSRAEQVARAAGNLLTNGGEERPRLRRDPRVPIHGQPVEAAS
jgi:hypothetical protein